MARIHTQGEKKSSFFPLIIFLFIGLLERWEANDSENPLRKVKNKRDTCVIPQTITRADTGRRIKFMYDGSLVKAVILK